MSQIKYVLYARKSTESEDKQVQSIEDQVDAMTEYAEKHGLRIVKKLRESRSAKTPHQRPEFTKMLTMIEDGTANGLICWQLNRLSRNPTESGMLQQLLQDEKILNIQTNDRTYLPDDNAIVFSVDAGMSNQFIRDLMKNVRRGMYSKAEKGWMPGIPPIGYMNDRENKIIVNDPERFELVRKMWDLMLTGTYTVKQISDIAEKDWGLRTIKRKRSGNKPLSYSSVYDMFHNQFYKGVLVYAGKESVGKHNAMVTEAEFDKVQRMIHNAQAARPKNEYIFTFRGLLRCGECGCAYTPQHNIKKQKNGTIREYDYYRCSLKRRDYQCSQTKYAREEKLNEQIKNELSDYTIMPKFYELAIIGLQEMNESNILQQVKVAETQRKAVTAKETELRELGRMRYRGECPDDEFYTTEKKKLEKELKDLQKARTKAEIRAEHWRAEADETFNFARYAEEDFESDILENKRKVLVKLGQNLTVLDGNIQFKPVKYLVPVKIKYPELQARYEAAITLPQQMKKAAEAAIFSDWYTGRDSNPRPSVPKTDALIH